MAGSVEVYGPTIANFVTADCEGLKSYQAQLQSEITRTASMSANELESEFKAISAALDKRTVALGKPITSSVVQQVRQLARDNTPTRVIGLKTGRTENSVRKIASDNNISLKPTNQTPYGTKKQ